MILRFVVFKRSNKPDKVLALAVGLYAFEIIVSPLNLQRQKPGVVSTV